jgi:hypothetical protein
VWSVDGNGNYLSNLIGLVSGTSTALESLETTFNQDLNGDGTIGIPKVVVQTDGSTALTQVGGNFFLNNTTTGSGPELKYNGAAVTAGEFGTWTPIGAVHVSGGGYDVAWHDSGSGLYTVWSVDGNGNYLSNLIGLVSGTSTALESLETTFNQDLNSDGVIGVPAATTPVTSSTSPSAAFATTLSSDSFCFRPEVGSKVVAANSVETNFSTSANNQSATLSSTGSGEHFDSLFEGSHDQTSNASDTHGQCLPDIHLVNLMASHFLFH